MSARTPTITLLGNNSGRNLGDAAILSSILDMLTKEIGDAQFYVPSINPEFIDQHYGNKYNVKGVNVLPYTGSMRLLGIPTMRCLAKSDVALICDGIIFGYKLFSPHNFLITLIFMVPWARLFGCKVVCFSCGIGPFPSALSRWCAKWVLNLCDLIIMRENDSAELAREIGVSKPIQVTGDAAFVNYISTPEQAGAIIRKHGLSPEKPLLGINVTPYIDSWLEKSERLDSKEMFLNIVAEGVNRAKEHIAAETAQDVQCAIFSCSPMDEAFCYELAEKAGGVVFDNSTYLSHDIQAVMKKCGLLVGMRFHSLVLSSAVGTPIVGMVYAPKVRGYMRLLDCEHYSVELRDITPQLLGRTIADAWNEREELQRKQQAVVAELAKGARNAAAQVRERYFPEYSGNDTRAVANA